VPCNKCDKDITPLDAPVDPPTVMQSPMTRARMRQSKLEVSSFLTDLFYSFENRLVLNDVIKPRNIEEDHEELRERCRGGKDQQGRPSQSRGPVNSSSSLPRPLGPTCSKIDTPSTYALYF